MNSAIKLGVIGCGGIAARRTIPEAIRHAANTRITAVMDIRQDVAERIAADFGIPHACASVEELLARDIDAVYIASPPGVHCAQAVLAARAGKHILCEKPLCLTLDEAYRMREAAFDNRVCLMPAYCMRFNPHHAKARELVRTGRLGRLVMARAQLTCWYPEDRLSWRQDLDLSGGGCFVDMGVHCIDLLEWIAGERAVEVCALHDQLVHAYRTPIEDVSTVQVRFAGRSHGIIDTSFCLPDAASQNRLELYLTGGSILASRTIGQEPSGAMAVIVQSQGEYAALQEREGGVDEAMYEFQGEGNYAAMVQAFSQSILDGAPPPVTADDGVHLVALTQAVNTSVAERRVVRVGEA
jgi:predicted dehydrogenase